MVRQFKKVAFVLTAGIVLLGLVSCRNTDSSIRIVEDLDAEPEYLSFFAAESLSDSDLGKYWTDHFANIFNQQVYISYDGATYYADKGLSYRELLVKRLESTAPDDLYIINAEDVLEFDKKGYWMDLSNMDFVNNLSSAALYQSTYNGKVFSVPLTFTGFGFYWNVTMLKELGLTVPNNLKEFWEVCEKLKESGILPYGANKGYGLTVPAMGKGLAKLYGSADSKKRIEDLNNKDTPISHYMSEGFEFLSEMIIKGYLDPKQAMNAEPRKEDIDLFLNGQCAFICIEMGAISTLKDTKKVDFKQEFTGIPLLENGCVAVYGADNRLCVNPNSKHLDSALKFVEMVGTREALNESAAWKHKMSSAKGSSENISSEQKKMYELLQQPGQIPNQDFSLHFNTWENIKNMGREICNGVSVTEVCAKFDRIQLNELNTYE